MYHILNLDSNSEANESNLLESANMTMTQPSILQDTRIHSRQQSRDKLYQAR